MDEVNAIRAVVMKRVQPLLLRVEVERLRPVVDDRPQHVDVDAVLPRRAVDRIGPARAPQPLAQVVDRSFAEVDFECGHRVILRLL
jgi:hypothetical protein